MPASLGNGGIATAVPKRTWIEPAPVSSSYSHRSRYHSDSHSRFDTHSLPRQPPLQTATASSRTKTSYKPPSAPLRTPADTPKPRNASSATPVIPPSSTQLSLISFRQSSNSPARVARPHPYKSCRHHCARPHARETLPRARRCNSREPCGTPLPSTPLRAYVSGYGPDSSQPRGYRATRQRDVAVSACAPVIWTDGSGCARVGLREGRVLPRVKTTRALTAEACKRGESCCPRTSIHAGHRSKRCPQTLIHRLHKIPPTPHRIPSRTYSRNL
jgi:hypothetical protein